MAVDTMSRTGSEPMTIKLEGYTRSYIEALEDKLRALLDLRMCAYTLADKDNEGQERIMAIHDKYMDELEDDAETAVATLADCLSDQIPMIWDELKTLIENRKVQELKRLDYLPSLYRKRAAGEALTAEEERQLECDEAMSQARERKEADLQDDAWQRFYSAVRDLQELSEADKNDLVNEAQVMLANRDEQLSEIIKDPCDEDQDLTDERRLELIDQALKIGGLSPEREQLLRDARKIYLEVLSGKAEAEEPDAELPEHAAPTSDDDRLF